MKRDEFNDYVRGVVRAGGSIEVKGVAAKLDVPKDDAKRWLEALYESGELELDLDTNDNFVYRKGKKVGAEKSAGEKLSAALAPLGTEAMTNAAKETAKKALLGDDSDDPTKKKMLWGLGLGFFLPGLGLFYSAPWVTAVLATLVVGVVVGILSYLPIIGGMLTYILVGAFMLISGILGAIYTYQYNKTGKRTRLSKGSDERRALPF